MNSITPTPGHKFQPGISEGLFDLDFPTYKGDPGQNASALKKISKSMRFWEASKKQPDKPSEDMIIGSLVHLSVLEPAQFGPDKSHYFKPATYLADRLQCPECGSITEGKKCAKCKVERVAIQIEQPWSGNSTTCQKWLEDHQDKPIIDSDASERVTMMRDAIMADEMAADFIKNAHTEVSAFATDPVTGERIKARFDLLALSEDAYIIGDFKKCQDADNEHSVAKYHADRQVHLQLAFYHRILELLTAEIPFPIRLLAGMIEDSIAPELIWWEMDGQGKSAGYAAWRKALDRYHFAKTLPKVPGYDHSQPVRKLSLPRYVINGDEG